MTEVSDAILNTAIEQLQAGRPVEVVLNGLTPLERSALEPMLRIAESILTTPRNAAPRPMRRYKFAEISGWERFWTAASPFAKFSLAPLAALLVILTTFKVTTATPDDTLLFSARKISEQVPLYFAKDQNKVLQIQLNLSEKRLSEAKTIIESSSSNMKQRTAALNELNSQTLATLSAVKQVAVANTISNTNSLPILNALDKIADDQAKLASKVQPQDPGASATSLALQTTKESKQIVADLKRLAATVNSQEPASLNPNEVTVIGTVSRKDSLTLTVLNNIFSVDGATVIKDENDKDIKMADLVLKARVTIVGTKNEKNELRADSITVLTAVDGNEAVKGATTETPASPKPLVPIKQESDAVTPTEPTQPDPNNAVGSSFFEAPVDLSQPAP